MNFARHAASPESSFIFLLCNMTFSLDSVKINLGNEAVQSTHVNIEDAREQNRWTSIQCASAENSTILLTNCDFITAASDSLFLVRSSLGNDDSASSLSITSCRIDSTSGTFGSFTKMEVAPHTSLWTDVQISGLLLDSVESVSTTGLASSVGSNSDGMSLETSLISCSLTNITSKKEIHQTPLPWSSLTQRVVGSSFEESDNTLYGTAIVELGDSQSFLGLNTTLKQCVNNDEPEPTEIVYTNTNDSTTEAGQLRPPATMKSIKLLTCYFTSLEPIKSFYVIQVIGFNGVITYQDCVFDVTLKTHFQTQSFLQPEIGSPSRFVVEGCTFAVSTYREIGFGAYTLRIENSMDITITDTTFTTHDEDHFTGMAALFTRNSNSPIQIAGCTFLRQNYTGDGSALLLEYTIMHIFDSQFEGCRSQASGGVLRATTSAFYFHRCTFRNNSAELRGGVMRLSYTKYLYFEDCHFDDNKANETGHWIGNDINDYNTHLKPYSTDTMVSCTSTSASNKIGYYISASQNGNITIEEELLPHPWAAAPATNHVFVSESGSDKEGEVEKTKCENEEPCLTIPFAIGILTKTAGGVVELGQGTFTDDTRTITSWIDMVGKGWLVNNTVYTILELKGTTVEGEGNATIRAVSLKPATGYTGTLLTLSSTTAKLRLSFVRLECISNYRSTLISASGGSLTLKKCDFNTISLIDQPAMTITGDTPLHMLFVWFTFVSTSSAICPSCVDSSSTNYVNFTNCDFVRCRSSSPVGAVKLTGGQTTSQFLFNYTYFSNNTANTNADGSVNNSALTLYGNDLAYSGQFLTGSRVDLTSRSDSPFPHILINETSTIDMYQPSITYYHYGVDMVLGNRFENGFPLSAFPGFQECIDRLRPGTTQQVQVRLLVLATPYIEVPPLVIANKSLSFYSPPLVAKQYDAPLVVIETGAYFRFYSINLNFTEAFEVTPFHLKSDAYRLQFTSVTFTHHADMMECPLVRHEGGTLFFHSFYWQPATPFTFVGCSMIESTGSEIQMLFSRLSNIHSTSNGSIANMKDGRLIIQQGTISDCSAVHGGLFFVELSGANSIQIRHPAGSFTETFISNTAIGSGTMENPEGKGGVFYVKGTTTYAKPFDFSSTPKDPTRFELNRAGNGTDLYLEQSIAAHPSVTGDALLSGYSLSQQYRVVIEGLEFESKNVLEAINYKLRSPEISVNGSYNGRDTQDCKWALSYCKTLGYGITFLHEQYQDRSFIPSTIRFAYNETYTEKDVQISKQIITVAGETTKNQAISEVTRSLIKIDTTIKEGAFLITVRDQGALTMTNLDMIPLAKCSLISLESDGEWVVLDNVGIMATSATTYKYSLIKTTAKPITIKNTLFNTSLADKAIFAQPLLNLFTNAEAEILLDNVTFKNLKIAEKTAEIPATPIIKIESNGAISFTDTTFDECEYSSTDNEKIFIAGSRLHTQIKAAQWKNSFLPTQLRPELMGTDESIGTDHEWYTGSLMYYLVPPVTRILLNTSVTETSTHPNCGSSRFTCSSLDSGYRSAETNEFEEVEMQTDSELLKTMTVTHKVVIQSQSETAIRTITQKSDSGIVVNAEGKTVTLQHMIFNLVPAKTLETFISVEAGELSLGTVTFGTNAETALKDSLHSLIRIKEGSLTLSSLSFVSSDAANVFSSQMIHSTAPLTLTNVNISSVSLSGVALIESWSDVLVDGCRFSSISRSTGLGSVIEANISVSTVIKILHTTFENCRSESTTNWILLKGLNAMTSEVSSWEGTLSRSSDRNGVMVADSDESTVYSLVDILFPRAISNVFVGGSGIDDLASCGDESAPCRTISIGFKVGLMRKDSSETVAVPLIDQTGFGGCVCVGSESLLITAGIGRPRLVVEDDLEKDSEGSGIVNVEGGSVTLSDLTLLLPTFASPTTAARPVSLIFGSGTALFSNIVVSQSSSQNVNLGLCWIVGGSLSLEQVRISQIEMSEDVSLIVAVSEAKPLLCSIVESEISRTSTTNSALLVFSSSSPLSHCQIFDCTFSHSTNTQCGTQSESAGSLLTISTKQAELSIEDTTFEECWKIPSSSAASIIHVTVFAHPSHSVSTVSVIRCKFLSSQSTSLPSSFMHFSLHSPHVSVLFEDSLFSEFAQTNTKGGVLIEYWAGLPIVIRRRTVFKHCTVILSEIQAQSSTHQNSRDEL
ncbi:hypothetical protein BLNAU_22963 [Blattamonas nauphoetae]|uniref:Uncharacterized protein n=1 Tax=Blattamonas nauphoetae TaxID=2049346 RepID=A0ABQ9WRM3_9EUKA|nr:hypothetical protein BLNAU_22963 [Blattamonas nauphoetae]